MNNTTPSNDSKEAPPRDGQERLAADAMTRLRRIEGQVRGIQRMLGRMGEDAADPSEGSECDLCDGLLTQILAVRSAVEKVGLIIFELHLQQCIMDEQPLSDERLQGLRDSLKLWARLA